MAAPIHNLSEGGIPFEGYDAARAFATWNARRTRQRQRVQLRTVVSRGGYHYRRWIVGRA